MTVTVTPRPPVATASHAYTLPTVRELPPVARPGTFDQIVGREIGHRGRVASTPPPPASEIASQSSPRQTPAGFPSRRAFDVNR